MAARGMVLLKMGESWRRGDWIYFVIAMVVE